MTNKKLLQVELNEFDPQFLRHQAEKLNLKNTLKFLDFTHSETMTDDKVEHQGLDPWVQWVNVHTGVPSDIHGIKRLGDTRGQKTSQIWEALAKGGKRWAVWGVMNAPMGNDKGGEVFMPDPWSFEEVAYPNNLNDLLSLPRYMARNYLDANKVKFTKKFMHFIRYYAPISHWPVLIKFTTEVVKSSIKPGITIHSLTTLLDYLGALEFVRFRKEKSPDYSVIFLNHIAHLQHQFWTKGEKLHPEMEFGLKVNNLIMGLLLESRLKNEAVIVLNGLKQVNVHNKGFYVYRQKKPESVFRKLTANERVEVEQCMTNDAHLRFESEEEATSALLVLRNLKLSDGHSLLFVERVSKNFIFVQLSVEHYIEDDVSITGSDREYNFYDLFELVCERTGAHVPNGDLFADGITFPDNLYNHNLFDATLGYFDIH